MPNRLQEVRCCTKCGSSDNGFFKDSRVADGLTSWCKPCFREYHRTRREKPEIREHLRELDAKYRAADPARVVERVKRYQRRHADRYAASQKISRKKNVLRIYAKNSARQRRVRHAMPPWANQFFIREIYHLAKLRSAVTGVKWHVDHIVPLKGKRVSGLHVETNMRVIPAQLNLLKSNRLI